MDGHPAIRQGLAKVLAAEGVTDCREAAERSGALEAVRRERPDLALVGLSMDDDESVALVADLTARRIPVLVFSEQEGPAHVRRAMAAGARAFVSKGDAPLGIARAVRDVLAGWILISPGAAEGLDGGSGLRRGTADEIDGPGRKEERR